jgi:hypothetical protein
MSLITIEQANDHLRLDLESDGNSPEDFSGDERTPEVLRKMDEATDAVLDYLKKQPDPPWTVDTVPPRVRAATLIVLTALYDDKAAGEMLKALAGGELNNPAVALLYRLRDPAIA